MSGFDVSASAIGFTALLACLVLSMNGSVKFTIRGLWRYRMGWARSMALCDLTVRERSADIVHAPRIAPGARFGCNVDRLPVLFVPGQTLQQWRDRADALASAFRATSCRVRSSVPGAAVLEFTHGDPLVDTIPALTISERPDLAALPVGLHENGSPWLIRLLGTHLLIAGSTGAGKGSVLWGLVRALCPDIRDGRVELWAADPKGGMELAPGERLFARFAYADVNDMIGLLEDAVATMDSRATRLRGVTRLHTPTREEPLIVVLVDELLSLTSYGVDSTARKRVSAALGALLSKGRAVGVLVVGAVQDPRKDSLPFRDLFPTRIALRLRERESVDLVLGDGAWKAGATCEQISSTQPGIGYVIDDASPDPVRVRAAYVSDSDIAAMVSGYHPPTMLATALGQTP